MHDCRRHDGCRAATWMMVSLWAVAVLCRPAPVVAAVAPFFQSMPVVSANPVQADNSTIYTVTVTAGDPDGYDDIRDVRVLFNYTEAAGNTSLGRGYLAWGKTDADITRFGGAWTLAGATGRGRWGYRTDAWGGTTYLTPLGCTVSVSGRATGGMGTMTIVWSFTVKPAWGYNPITNDADANVSDFSYSTGWLDNPNDFEVASTTCATTCVIPRAPVVSNPTPGTLDVAIHPADSGSDVFAIRISPAVNGFSYVQADGTIGPREVWRSRSEWGVRTVTGLMWNTSYSFSVRAYRFADGYCPSAWGPEAAATTLPGVARIEFAGGRPFNPGVRGQCPIRDIAADAIDALWNLAAGASGRGVAGGLDADTYDWRDVYSGIGGGRNENFSTLQFLQMARDHSAFPVFTANLFGGGAKEPPNGFICQTDNPEGLAADWVRYVNVILQQYRQGQEASLSGENLRVYNSITNWAGKPKLLSATEPPTPRVTYWEIGNEPELGVLSGYIGNHYLSPEDYRDRYKSISAAMRAVDADLKIGPCLMDPPDAAGSGRWLHALASDPAARIDFVAYHPYYQPIKWNWGNLPGMTAALRLFRAHLDEYAEAVHAIMTAYGRSGYELMASEWCPVNWDAGSHIQHSMANALGVVEGVFSFAEQGVVAAHFWVSPQAKRGPRDVYTALAQDMGDTLIATMADFGFDPHQFNWRLYVTQSATEPNKIAIWGLNFDEHVHVEVPLSLTRCRVDSAVLKRYGIPGDDAAGGDTSLMHNDGMAWEETDVTVDPRHFVLRLEDAEVTVLVLHITRVPSLDHDRDGDVDLEDFGWFQACLSGAGVLQDDPQCADALREDQDVDEADMEAFQRCFTGPGRLAEATCAD
ncbi:MAG TPA: hypothetical protein PLS23_00500 [Phycisphaerae bacterium]|nr:hypothetical protein [Phycisphaerae bacterium]